MRRSKGKDLSLAEAGDFFDTHDILMEGASNEVKDLSIRIPRKKYVGLDARLFKKIEQAAKKAHKSEDRLIEEWLAEKVG